MSNRLFFSANSAIKEYDKFGYDIIYKILRSYEAGEFGAEERKILPIIEKAAEKGNSKAQRLLAEEFLEGKNKPENLDKATFWLEKAVDPKGRDVSYEKHDFRFWGTVKRVDVDSKAQYLLALIREKAGGEENLRQAVRLYADSARKSYIESYYELARICEKGKGIPKNLPAAIYWYRMAYTKGMIYGRDGFDIKSKFAYEQIIQQLGETTWESAAAYYLLAHDPRDFLCTWVMAETGCGESQYKLGMLLLKDLFIPKDGVAGTNWLKKSAEQNYFRAPYQLGMSYYLGEGVHRDFEKAAKWFRKGAGLGRNVACHALGFLYQEGRGVPKDIEVARHWYHKALNAHFPPNDHGKDDGYHKAEDALKNLFYPSLTRALQRLLN